MFEIQGGREGDRERERGTHIGRDLLSTVTSLNSLLPQLQLGQDKASGQELNPGLHVAGQSWDFNPGTMTQVEP